MRPTGKGFGYEEGCSLTNNKMSESTLKKNIFLKTIAVRELGPSGLDSGLSQKCSYKEKQGFVG